METKWRFDLGFLLFALAAILILQGVRTTYRRTEVIPYAEFLDQLHQDKIAEVQGGDHPASGPMGRRAASDAVGRRVRCCRVHLHYLPVPMFLYAIFAGALLALFVLIQLGVLRYAYMRIGLEPRVAMLVLFGSLLGSYVNIPVARLPAARVAAREVVDLFGIPYVVPVEVDWPGTVIAVNVGGALIPILLSIYLLAHNRIWVVGTIATAIVALFVHLLAHLVPGVGITVPIFAPFLITAAVAVLLSREFAAPLAYVSGSLGTLIGADLSNLGQIGGLGTPIASIGGAGTFDGVFLTGILAVLLAGIGLRGWRSEVAAEPSHGKH